MKNNKKRTDKSFQKLALLMTVECVRNTIIEEYHCGITLKSKTGDYSDVKVVTPYGEIPWNELSRISDEEMKEFNIEVTNKIYTYLQYVFNQEYEKDRDKFLKISISFYPHNWNKPEFDESFINSLKITP